MLKWKQVDPKRDLYGNIDGMHVAEAWDCPIPAPDGQPVRVVRFKKPMFLWRIYKFSPELSYYVALHTPVKSKEEAMLYVENAIPDLVKLALAEAENGY